MNVNDYYIHSDSEISGFCKEYVFLSSFYKIPIWYEGALYTSVENAYQAMKFPENERKVFCGISSSEAKKLGRTAPIGEDWDLKKFDIMSALVFTKFCDEDLKLRLLNTGTKQLRELNHWYDLYWGVDYKTNKGENNLGKILMRVRDFWKK